MRHTKLGDIFKSVKTSVKKHSPEILTGIGIGGMVTSTVLAVKATPKALRMIEQEEQDRGEQLTKTEVIKTTWKCYIPSAVIGTVSIGCLIGASSVNTRRNAALATAYKISETALTEYREKVVETIGEKKEKTVRESIAKDKIDKNPVSKNEVVITGKGETLCYDSISGRYFKSDIEKLKRAVNDLNRLMRDELYISLNEFYYEIGLDGIGIGDTLGWNIDRGYIDLSFSSQLADDGTPCLVVQYSLEPRYDYQN